MSPVGGSTQCLTAISVCKLVRLANWSPKGDTSKIQVTRATSSEHTLSHYTMMDDFNYDASIIVNIALKYSTGCY